MSINVIGWESYDALRQCVAGHEDVRAAMIAQGLDPEEPAGGWRLGHTSSWGRWASPADLTASITASSEADFRDMAPLTTSVVFLAINWGGVAPPVAARDWQNFHARGHAGDTNLSKAFAEAMVHTGFPAAPYMSDVFKLIPTPTAAALGRTIRDEEKDGRDPIGRCIDVLEKELTICRAGNEGRKPVIVGIGAAAYGWLSGRRGGPTTALRPNRVSTAVGSWLGEDASEVVRWMPHYTFGSSTHASRVAALVSIFEEAASDA